MKLASFATRRALLLAAALPLLAAAQSGTFQTRSLTPETALAAARAALEAARAGGDAQALRAAQHLGESVDLAAAVADQFDVLAQQVADAFKVATARGIGKGPQQAQMGLATDGEARALGLQAFAGTVHQLAAGGFALAQGGGHIRVVGIEDLAQQKGGAFFRRQLLQHGEKGDRDVIDQFQLLLGRFGQGLHQRLGQPEAAVVLALGPHGAQPVDGQPGDDGDQPSQASRRTAPPYAVGRSHRCSCAL